jgi:tRNA nucleotidyltransferase (CCA-adding enzyme)
MPDYMYLLESRLSPEQRAVLERVQELARVQEANVYLSGGAVRDLVSGMPIRDLDFTVEGNPFRMVRELEKGGARVVVEDERLRHIELIFAGDVDGSISAARDDYYDRPGARPEIRWSTIMEDLRRRDFSLNAVAISLNPASRGLLLDPTNGLADLERREVRGLSIHAFTNQPIRLLRILRYCARMGFKMEARTSEWFELAMARGLHESLEGAAVGWEIRNLAREDNPVTTLRQWESRGLLGVIHAQLARRRPDYESLTKLSHVREQMVACGVRPRLFAPVTHYLVARLKSREAASALRRMELRQPEIDAVSRLIPDAGKALKILKSSKTNSPRDAYFFIASLPPDLLAFSQVEYPHPKAMNKIRNYLQRWRPLRVSLPVAELDALGVPRGPKFDKILEQLFEQQLRGRGRTPPDRTKVLRQLAGIKEEPKKKAKEEKKGKAKATAKELKAHAKRKAAKAVETTAAPPEGEAKELVAGAASGASKEPRKAVEATASAARQSRPRHAHKPKIAAKRKVSGAKARRRR